MQKRILICSFLHIDRSKSLHTYTPSVLLPLLATSGPLSFHPFKPNKTTSFVVFALLKIFWMAWNISNLNPGCFQANNKSLLYCKSVLPNPQCFWDSLGTNVLSGNVWFEKSAITQTSSKSWIWISFVVGRIIMEHCENCRVFSSINCL